jgi:site-specific DNA recombinase
MTLMSIKYFIYTRKSTDDTTRQVRSIDDQKAELRELARQQGITIVDVLVEKQSAKIPGRPVFNDMLDRIERGEAAGIIAWHPDRLARNSLDGGRVIYLVDTGKIKDMRFSTFWFDSTPQGKLMLSIAFGMSKYYVDNLSENIKRGHRQKLKKGIFPQRAPIGYLNDPIAKTIGIDPERAPLIRKAFEMYAEGNHTLRQVQEAINALGLLGRRNKHQRSNTLAVGNYQYILKNPVYYGVLRFDGELYEGRHEPIITKKLFDAAQAVMLRKSKPKGRGLKPYLYRGCFRCDECGCFITIETQKGHNYLRCTKRVKPCSQPCIREESVSAQVGVVLGSVSVSDGQADRLIAALESDGDRGIIASETIAAGFRARIAESDVKINRLTEAYLDQAVSLDEFRDAKAQLVQEKQDWKEKAAALTDTAHGRFEPAIRFVKAVKQSHLVARTGSPEEKRDFVKKLGSNLRFGSRQLLWEPRGAWKLVVNPGVLAQHNTPASLGRGGVDGEAHLLHKKAERVGFEPTVTLKRHTGFRDRLLQPLGHLSREPRS